MPEVAEHVVKGMDSRATLLGFGSGSTTVVGSVSALPWRHGPNI